MCRQVLNMKKTINLPKLQGTYGIAASNKMPGGISLWINRDNIPWEINEWVQETQHQEYNNLCELPVTYIPQLLYKSESYDIEINIPDTKKTEIQPTVPSTIKTKLFDHQLTGFTYAVNNSSFILGDDLGLGKTIQTITYAAWLKEQGLVDHCLVICCTGTLKFNWLEEVSKHSTLSARILAQRTTRRGNIVIGSVKDRIEELKKPIEEFFVITNKETLRDKQIQNLIKKGPNKFDMVVLDEIHKANNPTSKQGKAILDLFTGYKYVVPISGTISPHRPENCFVPLTLIRQEHCTWTNFKKFYTIQDGMYNAVTGYKNLEILREQLNSCMLRRKKEKVLPFLPPKIWKEEFLELDTSQEALYEEVLSGVRENIKNDINLSVVNIAAQMTRLRQVTGCPHILTDAHVTNVKMDRMEELVEEIVYSGHKCVIASKWTNVTDEVLKRLHKWGTVEITGKISDIQRQTNKEKFQNDDTVKVCVGTHDAMGVGITLTAADYIIFMDDPWSKADKTQVEDRLHRIGTKNNVTIITLICKNTIDEFIHELVYKKGLLLDFLNGDITTADYKQSMQQLLTMVLG